MKSHEMLLKLLNNIGIVGAILAGIADIIFVMIFVFGIKIDVQNNAIIVFAVINSLIGVLISILLRYQGQKYAEIENEDLCKRFYAKKVKESKRFISMNLWQLINVIKDLIINLNIFSLRKMFWVLFLFPGECDFTTENRGFGKRENIT